jgi:F0F1-type ATP synthase membrane subunit b/b'
VNDRNGYILNNLSRTSELLLEANQLTTDYQNNLELTSQDAQRELLQIQKLQQETLNAEVKFIQSKINNEQVKARETRAWKKKLILRQVKPEIDTLTDAIMTKLSM